MLRNLCCLAMLAGLPAAAVLAAEEAKGPWSGSVSLGYVSVGGNSDTESINFKGELKYEPGRWHHMLSLAALGASQDDETTAEAYRAIWTTQFDLSERIYLFGTVDYYKDKFSGFERQLSETAGVGWRALRTASHQLDLSLGAGARQARLREGGTENEAVGRAGARYQWKITDTSSFVQTLGVVSGSDNTLLESVSELKAAVIGNLAMALGYTIKRNTSVPAGSRNTDTLATVALEYQF